MSKEGENQNYMTGLSKTKGAFQTKTYKNVFQECGYSQNAIDEKVKSAWNTMFYGNDDEKIYYESGENEAYILDVGNGDVRSEGMSYGMMMCVQMNKQKEFNKLWKWAKDHMQIATGYNKGYFRWSMNRDGTPNSEGPAPDGEEYFAMALFFASNRWGDKETPFDYKTEARYILHQAIHQEHEKTGGNLWDVDNKMIRFVPNVDFTDPSYHLPHFYELFALWADKEDQIFWKEATEASRKYLKIACHSKTGLSAEYAEFTGEPKEYNGGHDIFASDAYRVAGNIALDYIWFAKDSWEKEELKKLQSFFVKEGLDKYDSMYQVDGEKIAGGNYQAMGLGSMNATTALAKLGDDGKAMVEKLWNTDMATGKWRYYDNCLYFFSLLTLSGTYKIYA